MAAFHTVSFINDCDYSIKGMQCPGITFLERNHDILKKTYATIWFLIQRIKDHYRKLKPFSYIQLSISK